MKDKSVKDKRTLYHQRSSNCILCLSVGDECVCFKSFIYLNTCMNFQQIFLSQLYCGIAERNTFKVSAGKDTQPLLYALHFLTFQHKHKRHSSINRVSVTPALMGTSSVFPTGISFHPNSLFKRTFSENISLDHKIDEWITLMLATW